jgi:acetylornithine deacetylase/succinyl-diaminopimelate desuccinylase-like protein
MKPMRIASLLAAIAAFAAAVAAAQDKPHEKLAFDIYRELVEINTVTATGDTARAAQAMAARLRAAGFAEADVQLFTPAPRKGNLVARLRGSGARKPIVLMAHIDVVEARKEDWTTDPFKLVEKDGYYYARGSTDDKFMAAAFVANLIRYREEGFRPDRDLVLVLETDEEIGDADGLGIQWLIKNHRDLLEADFALNEGAGVGLKDGKPLRVGVQTSEKIYVTYQLEVKDKGGHSSQPGKDNAIYRLAAGLTRLSKHRFPVHLNDTTRVWLVRAAALEDPQTAADMRSAASGKPDPAAIARLSAKPPYNAQLRTTCVATMASAGHAENALPQSARATVNCRVLPNESPADVQKTLERVLADDRIAISVTEVPGRSGPSPLRPDLMGAIEKVSAQFWPGAPVIPSMSAGATDGRFLRAAGIPTYGHGGGAFEIDENRAHGKDERMPVKSFYDGLEYLYRLVKALAS